MVCYYIINILFIAVLGYHDMRLGQEGMIVIILCSKHGVCVLLVLIRTIYIFKYEVFSSVDIMYKSGRSVPNVFRGLDSLTELAHNEFQHCVHLFWICPINTGITNAFPLCIVCYFALDCAQLSQ